MAVKNNAGLLLVQEREVEMGSEMEMDQLPKQNIVNGTPDLDRGVIGMIFPLGHNNSR